MRHKTGSILGTFGKGVENSISINFGLSAGNNCETNCQHHPNNNGACYAVRVEIRPDRKGLTDKLARHEAMPGWMICGKAIIEIKKLLSRGYTIPWARFSTNGSLPKPSEIRNDKLFRTQFRALIKLLSDNAIPMHLPVESNKKARFYRSLVGDLVAIRESIQKKSRFESAVGAVSIVVGTGKLRERIETARKTAKQRTENTGRKTIVCPAVVASFKFKLKNRGLTTEQKTELKSRYGKAKCGACTACSDPCCDIVYPIH